jgi:hypothetical protein
MADDERLPKIPKRPGESEEMTGVGSSGTTPLAGAKKKAPRKRAKKVEE